MKKILLFLKKLFARSKYFIHVAVKPSVATVNLLKAFVDSPLAPVITALIPGEIDNMIADKLRRHLPEALKVLGFADECINAGSNDLIVQCAIAKLRLYNPTQQAAAWHNIASVLSQYLSDDKLTWSEAVHLAEMVYNEIKPKQ
jgi:hypothetical protein